MLENLKTIKIKNKIKGVYFLLFIDLCIQYFAKLYRVIYKTYVYKMNMKLYVYVPTSTYIPHNVRVTYSIF